MRKHGKLALASIVAVILVVPAPMRADDDDAKAVPKPVAADRVTRASKDVPELILGSSGDHFKVNRNDFELVAGQGYRWKITSAAGLEYKFATDLFRNVWMNQIVINDLEVHMDGAPAWLEFDSEGTIQVQFTAIRPGTYRWSIPDLADKGMKGTITIK